MPFLVEMEPSSGRTLRGERGCLESLTRADPHSVQPCQEYATHSHSFHL
ncbi:hypothetical protein BDFB_004182 [Asbolus verrucosus]|uniref:Uncharacterized protein n=1 Tax=Asbolus verrucosus TaxID=1661398 RepID=A0A482VN61_ASBVE|nr:hypothetical protein BDFB_004182 [Asbolus verrucosus]